MAMKLSNIASVDPTFRESGRRGLPGASVADRAIWEEMNADWPAFAAAANDAMGHFGLPVGEKTAEPVFDDSESTDFTGRERVGNHRERVGQDLFRESVLTAYEHRCCITGLALAPLLNASHIVPWREYPANRLNPANGLCLSALHDRAFDKGYITSRDDLTVAVSARGRELVGSFFDEAISAYEDSEIVRPGKFEPAREFLARHREEVFLG